MNNGWIKLHRQLWENPHLCNPSYLSVWIWIITHCQHGKIIENGKWRAATEEERKQVRFDGKTIRLLPGQVTCGAYQIAKMTGVARGTVERVIKCFKSEEQIEVRTDRQCSLITVKNWKDYQEFEERNEERPRNDRGTSEERVRTNKEYKNGKNGSLLEKFEKIEISPALKSLKKKILEAIGIQDFVEDIGVQVQYLRKIQRIIDGSTPEIVNEKWGSFTKYKNFENFRYIQSVHGHIKAIIPQKSHAS